jgi:hypothetical protein
VCCAFAVLYARDARMRRDGGDLVYAMRAAASPAETVPGRSTAR